jgi:hypothetical protein
MATMLAPPGRVRAAVAGPLVRVAAPVGRAARRGSRHDRGMAGGRRDDARAGAGAAVRVDLAGLPTSFPFSEGRWLRWVGAGLVALGAVGLVGYVLGSRGDLQPWFSLAQVALGVNGLLEAGAARLVLEPDGYRVAGRFLRSRLRPWADVGTVDPGSPRWGTAAELRGPRVTSGSAPLRGLGVEQAEELGRRLREARARAGADA